MEYIDLVRNFVDIPCKDCKRFNSIGETFYGNNEYYEGNYWFYDGEDFIVDIHDFFIKKDYIEENIPNMSDYFYLISSYLLSGSGEWLEPYQVIEPNSMFVLDTTKPIKRYILHGNSRFFVVGMKFKERIVNEILTQKFNINKDTVSEIFLIDNPVVTGGIGKIASEIINCKMDGLSAQIFFEAKAREWLSIYLNAYENDKNKKELNPSDKGSIENIARYIEDHYAFDISQAFLEKLSMMSGTKLKESFKKRYNMSITEFTQKKRINIAENLLLTTDLAINDIAKAVGYNSHSRFSALFKRYKGVYPKDIRKNVDKPIKHVCNFCKKLPIK